MQRSRFGLFSVAARRLEGRAVPQKDLVEKESAGDHRPARFRNCRHPAPVSAAIKLGGVAACGKRRPLIAKNAWPRHLAAAANHARLR
jgi:hypothetical protein